MFKWCEPSKKYSHAGGKKMWHTYLRGKKIIVKKKAIYLNERLHFCETKNKRINSEDIFPQPVLHVFKVSANINGGHSVYIPMMHCGNEVI